MSLFHPKRYKVSFAEGSKHADISANRLEIGAENVRFHPRIDDKSSCFPDLFAVFVGWAKALLRRAQHS